MANGGILKPASENKEYALLWTETQKRLDRFLPGMFQEIFPKRNVTASMDLEDASGKLKAPQTKAQ